MKKEKITKKQSKEKKIFEKPKITIIKLQEKDIITTSEIGIKIKW